MERCGAGDGGKGGCCTALPLPCSSARPADRPAPPPRLLPSHAQEGGPPPADSSPPPSYEGGERRCFKRMFVCTEDVRYALAVPKDGSTPRPLVFRWYEYAQHIVRQVTRRSQEQQEQQQQGSGAAVGPLTAAQEDEERQRRERDVSVLRRLGSDSADSPVTLRVVFQKRGNADKRERQLDNAADLIERCNAWRYTAPSGARVRGSCTEVSASCGCGGGCSGSPAGAGMHASTASCTRRPPAQRAPHPHPCLNCRPTTLQAEFPSLAAGVAVAQEADVMVGAHGANLGNAWFMRPGTSVVELTMFGFDDRIAHGNNARFNVMVRCRGRLGMQRWPRPLRRRTLRCSQHPSLPGSRLPTGTRLPPLPALAGPREPGGRVEAAAVRPRGLLDAQRAGGR